MTREGKIAWFGAGAVLFGFFAFSFTASILYAMAMVLPESKPDAIGLVFTVGVILVFCVLPGFAAWKCFQAGRRLSRERRDEFHQKEAFK